MSTAADVRSEPIPRFWHAGELATWKEGGRRPAECPAGQVLVVLSHNARSVSVIPLGSTNGRYWRASPTLIEPVRLDGDGTIGEIVTFEIRSDDAPDGESDDQPGALPETQRRRRGHGFYPTKGAGLPALGATSDVPEAEHVVRAHYFGPSQDWWLVEYDPATGDAFGFGFVNLGDPQNAEWGSVSLVELEAINHRPEGFPLDVIIERDCHWTPKRFAEIERAGR